MTHLQNLLNKYLSRVTPTGSNYKALCPDPDHNDHKLGSFYISPEKGHMKCFACGYYSTIFDFLLDSGASIDDALEYLREADEREVVREFKDDVILGRAIPKSFIDRGFTKKTIKHFEVGYNALEKCVTIPLKLSNNLRGVYYRVYPKTIWFSKSFDRESYIFNFYKTKKRIYVEGPTDTMMVFQNGSLEVSCTLGTEISKRQLRMMSSHEQIDLAYDFDLAGIQAMYYIYYKLNNQVEINVIPYRADRGDKNDPGNCSEAAWKKGVQNTQPFVLFDLAVQKRNPNMYNLIKEYLWKRSVSIK